MDDSDDEGELSQPYGTTQVVAAMGVLASSRNGDESSTTKQNNEAATKRRLSEVRDKTVTSRPTNTSKTYSKKHAEFM
jgi:hypothetical protein